MVAAGRVASPAEDSLQTRTLRYSKTKRLAVHALAEHWLDSTIDASFANPLVTTMTVSPNVLAFEVHGAEYTTYTKPLFPFSQVFLGI
jgi:hypothetical protein